jgi:PIN domain nuclease of toxin-antitoxin system
VHPFEQVASDQILEARRIAGYHRPVQVVVLLLLLHRPDARRSGHDDPFDRMLIAQARVEKLRAVSADRAWRRYELDLATV